jgi:hypothetical protein
MKTTHEIPDELCRAMKAKAASEEKPAPQLVMEALRVVMPGAEKPVSRVQSPIIMSSPKERKVTVEELKPADLGGQHRTVETVRFRHGVLPPS